MLPRLAPTSLLGPTLDPRLDPLLGPAQGHACNGLRVLAEDRGARGSSPPSRAAFDARMQSAWPWVTRLVERLLGWPGRASDVEDVAQEVFLAAWRGRERFRGDAEWSTWVHAIAVSKARNAARSRERRQRWFGVLLPASDLDGPDLEGSGSAAGEADVHAPGGSLEARRALGALRHGDREVLVLRYLEELERDVLAARLGIGVDALDARLSRARKRLRALLPTDASAAWNDNHGGPR